MMDEVEGRRIRAVRFSPTLCAMMLRDGHEIHVRIEAPDLPADARMCGSAYDPVGNCFLIFMEHPSFELVVEGAPFPQTQAKIHDLTVA